MSSTLYYKPFRWAIYRNLAFSAGLFISISLMNYAYNILAYDILPYSSLRTVKIIALILMGSGIGMIIKIIAESKETSETLQ